jgi:hypothetical protein
MVIWALLHGVREFIISPSTYNQQCCSKPCLLHTMSVPVFHSLPQQFHNNALIMRLIAGLLCSWIFGCRGKCERCSNCLKALSRYLTNWIPFQATSLQWRDCLRLMQSLFITPIQGKNKICKTQRETVPLRVKRYCVTCLIGRPWHHSSVSHSTPCSQT